MKQRVLSAVIYATTAFALAQLFDAIFAGEPVTAYLGVIYLAIAGTILFAAACFLSLFAMRVGVVFGLGGCILAWPWLALAISTVPWARVISIFPVSNWPEVLTTILALVVANAYSLNRLRLLLRRRNDLEGRNVGLKLAVALSYAAGIFVLTNWRSIWDWLFRLRYGK